MRNLFAIRIDDNIEKRIKHFMEVENMDKSSAGRKLLSLGLRNWAMDRAIELLSRGEISISKGAELAGVSVWKMLEIVKNNGLRVSVEDMLKDLKAKVD